MSYMYTVAVVKEGRTLFKESGNNAVVVTTDGTLTYSYNVIQLNIASIKCVHDGVYTFTVNNALQGNTTLVTISK